MPRGGQRFVESINLWLHLLVVTFVKFRYTGIMETIDDMIRNLKGKCGVSGAQIADELGITRSAISHWRKGRAPVSAEKEAQFHALYVRHMSVPVSVKKPKPGTRRAEIVDLASSGVDYAEIGRRFDISRERVRQIVQQHGALPRQR